MEDAPKIRIGTAGWSYKDWDGVFYPPEVQRKKVHPLEYLAHFFDVVEINTSFYGHIKPELAKLWLRKIAFNPNFVFTAKLHRSFTHSPLGGSEPTSAAPSVPTMRMRPGPGKGWTHWRARRKVRRASHPVSGFVSKTPA